MIIEYLVIGSFEKKNTYIKSLTVTYFRCGWRFKRTSAVFLELQIVLHFSLATIVVRESKRKLSSLITDFQDRNEPLHRKNVCNLGLHQQTKVLIVKQNHKCEEYC